MKAIDKYTITQGNRSNFFRAIRCNKAAIKSINIFKTNRLNIWESDGGGISNRLGGKRIKL